MLHRDGRAILCDFGLGRMTSAHAGASALSVTAVGGGTLQYLAPELLDDVKRASTAASDVYALGCVGFCLIAAVPQPWHGLTADSSEIATRVRSGERPLALARERLLDAHPELVAWVERCWAHDEKARFTPLEAAEGLCRMFPEIGDDAVSSMSLSLASSIPVTTQTHSLSDYATPPSMMVSDASPRFRHAAKAPAASDGSPTGYADLPPAFPEGSLVRLLQHHQLPQPPSGESGATVEGGVSATY